MAKWVHIIAMVSWMAGILYLVRLLVYHTQHYGEKQDIHDLLVIMERRLANYITRPAMAVTWISGLTMAGINHSIAAAPWFWWKLLLVVIMTLVTELTCGYCKRLRKQGYPAISSIPSTRSLRWINEIPTLLLVLIVGLVIFRPFL